MQAYFKHITSTLFFHVHTQKLWLGFYANEVYSQFSRGILALLGKAHSNILTSSTLRCGNLDFLPFEGTPKLMLDYFER